MDLIEREAAIKEIRKYFAGLPIRVHYDMLELVRNLPSAHQWIPVSERLPSSDDWVIVTVLDESGDTPYRYTDLGWYLDAANCWIRDAKQITDVIAWMPLPEPYKGEKDE